MWKRGAAHLVSTIGAILLVAFSPQAATATHTTSPYTEHPSRMATTLVQIWQDELPTFPSVSPRVRPYPVGPYQSVTTGGLVVGFYQPSDNWLQKPDGSSYTGLPDPSTCSNTLTVTGYFYAYDDSGNVRPMSWGTAWVFDVDLEAGLYPRPNPVGWALIEDDGRFSVGPFCNQDGSDFTNKKDIVVAAVPISSAAQVLRYVSHNADVPGGAWQFSPYVYTAWAGPWNNQPDGTLDVGGWIVPKDTRVDDAFRVYGLYSGILAGWDLVVNKVDPAFGPLPPVGVHSPFGPLPQVEVHYPAPLIRVPILAIDMDAPGEPFPHYMVAGSKCGWTKPPPDLPWWRWLIDPVGAAVTEFLSHPHSGDCAQHWDGFGWQIHIDSQTSARNPFVVNHLYAHYVMQRGYNGAYPSNGPMQDHSSRFAGDFDEDSQCDSPSDGTPSYQLYCERRLTADYSSYDDSGHGAGIAWAEGFADAFALRAMATRPGGLETRIFSFQRSPQDPNTAWSFDFEPWRPENKVSKEMTVAGVLHDLDDSHSNGADTYAGGFDRVWKAFTFQYVNDIREYWSSWIGQFHLDHPQVTGAAESFRQRDLVTYRAKNLTQSSATETSITINWTNYDDWDFSRLEVHMSTDAGFVPSDSTKQPVKFDSYNHTGPWTKSGLTSCTTYYFELAAYNKDGWPAHSEKVEIKTTGCPAGGGGGGGSNRKVM